MGCGSSHAQVQNNPQEESQGAQQRRDSHEKLHPPEQLRSAGDINLPSPVHPNVPVSLEDAQRRKGYPHKLKVTVLNAQELRAADRSLIGRGSSDPYCTCAIQGKPETSVSTKHINKDINPVWDEQLEIDDFINGDTLEFTVWDYDKHSADDLLGAVLLDCKAFFDQGSFSGVLHLEALPGQPAISSKLSVKVEVVPPRPAALPVSVIGSRLKVVMLSASDLRAADFALIGKGKSDPYCTCELLGKPDSYVETRTLDKDLNPVWYEEHIIEDYTLGDNLAFTVKDRDKMQSSNSDDLLGRAILDFREFDREDGFDGELNLKECGKGHRAKLKVQVTILPPTLPDAPAVSVPGSRLSVTMISASGLRAADKGLLSKGKSDPFCCCEIRGRPDSKVQTRHLPKTLEPIWNETHDIDYMEHGDNLVFAVYDHDKGSAADLLGKVTLPSRDYDREGGFDGELRLKECGKGRVATLKVKVDVLPPLFPDAPPVSKPGCRLRVIVISASGLPNSNGMFGGKSDPYCILGIPGKPDSECQTPHINKTLDPQWNEDFEMLDYDPGDDLEFRVMDYNKLTSAVQLGRVTLPSRVYDREGGFDGDLRLKESKTQSFLKLKVEILPPLLSDAPPVSLPGSSLLVLIRSAVGLRAADISLMSKATSDPYCTCQIKDKPDSHFQTRHLSKTLEPQWEEEHDIETFDHGDDLEFTLWDYDMVGSHDLLGRAILRSREYDREGGFDGDVRLRECGKGRKAFLNVRVLVLPPDGPDGPPISEPGSRLKIIVHSAVGLRGADLALLNAPTSDPFCICRIPSKEDTEFQTQCVMKTLDPIWDEEHEIDDFDRGDDLEFVVMDYDRIGSNDLLGRRTLPSFKFDRDGGFQGEIKLKEGGKGKKPVLRLQVLVLPPAIPAAAPISEPGSRLRINFLSASGLRPADLSGSSDPYCRCEIVGKSSTMIETRALEKNLQPVWDEERILTGYELGDRLKFQVFDFDRNSQNDLLGRIALPSREFDREGGFSGELRLKACGKKNQAYLRVQIEVLPSVETEQRLLEEARELERERRCEARELEMMAFAEQDTRERQAAEREMILRQQEEAAREADRRAKEEARRLAELEAYRKAHAKEIAEAEAKEIVVTISPVFAPSEVLAEVIITAGSTVEDLSNMVFANARLPIHPRLIFEDKLLHMSHKLLDVGIKDEDIVVGEMCAVLTTSKDSTAKIWDALSGKCLYTLQSHDQPVCMACSTPNLKLIATCSMDQTAKLWIVQSDLRTITCLFTLRGHESAVNTIAFSPDYKMVVTASDDRKVKIWSVKTGECKRTFDGHRDAVLTASFTPDGLRLCTQSKDGTSKIFEVDTGRITDSQPLRDQGEGAVTSATATACDGRIIVNSSDKSAKVFDVTGETEHILEGHTDSILSVAIVDVTVPTRPSGALMVSRTFTKSLSPMSKKSRTFSNTKKLSSKASSGLLREASGGLLRATM